MTTKTLKVTSLKDLLDTPRAEFSYKYDDKYFTICETKNGKTRELYWFEKDSCNTQWEQFDWIHQVLTKTWMTDTFNFVKAFHEAVDDWFDIKITHKEKK